MDIGYTISLGTSRMGAEISVQIVNCKGLSVRALGSAISFSSVDALRNLPFTNSMLHRVVIP